MKTILVPTDFSENADNAFEYALKFAKDTEAQMLLVHGYFSVFISPDIPAKYILEQIEENEKSALDKLKPLKSKAESAGIKCEIINREEMAVDLILDIAEKRNPDYIIMGTKGAGNITTEIFGTNTAKVLKKTKCPVITIPSNAGYKPLKTIVYATDYHTNDIEVVKSVSTLGHYFDSQIKLIHISDLGFYDEIEEQDDMDKFKKIVTNKIDYPELSFTLYNGALLTETFEEMVNKESGDMLVMSTYHRSLFDRLFGISSAKGVAYHTKVPLMTFHSDENPHMLFD